MAISDWNNIFSQPDDDQYSFDYGSSNATIPLKSILNNTYPSTTSFPNVTVSVTSPSSTIGTVGGTLTTAGNGSLNWSNNTYNTSYTATATPYSITAGSLSNGYAYGQSIHVKGDAEFEGDVKIGGVSLVNRLDEIEKRLAILRPNNDLEGKWEELKELGERYRQLEQEILEKEKVWDILKK